MMNLHVATRKLAAPALAALAGTFMLSSMDSAQALSVGPQDFNVVKVWMKNPTGMANTGIIRRFSDERIGGMDITTSRFYAAVRPESSPRTVSAEVSATFSRGKSTSDEPSFTEWVGAIIATLGGGFAFGRAWRRINQLQNPTADLR